MGATGARGKSGHAGPIGKTGVRGAKGTAGAKGATGKHGATGATGQEPPRRRKLLDVVQVQISRIDHELRIQMTRMAQIQAEVDQLRANLKRLADDSN
jgi:Collagen triple helix repeat (20 copies)